VIVPEGYTVRYGYVTVGSWLGFESAGGMQAAKVAEYAGAYSEMDGAQPADCPWVVWYPGALSEGYKVQDGRHRFLGAIMAGYEEILVRWLERPEHDDDTESDVPF
jgi:hypothetical protein